MYVCKKERILHLYSTWGVKFVEECMPRFEEIDVYGWHDSTRIS